MGIPLESFLIICLLKIICGINLSLKIQKLTSPYMVYTFLLLALCSFCVWAFLLWSHCWQGWSWSCDKPREVCLPPPRLPACLPSCLWKMPPGCHCTTGSYNQEPPSQAESFSSQFPPGWFSPLPSFSTFPGKSHPSSGLSGSARVWFYARHFQTINPLRLCLSLSCCLLLSASAKCIKEKISQKG